MSLAQTARLVAWKLSRRVRETLDGYGGYRRVERDGARWAAGWRECHHGDAADWLARPGGGELWIPQANAPEWARRTCTSTDLALAEAAVAGVFDLLGSGPVHLGEEPAWRTDLYSGREWPLEEAHRLRIVRGDGSDIRTVWELGRAYHHMALARAYWTSGDARFLNAFTRHVESWIGQNPVGYGPNWASPMDAAIRAANWSISLVLFARAPGIAPSFWERMLANLYSTGLYIERHLEWHPVYRGNHFVANGVGLVYLGALFGDDLVGGRWLRRGARLLESEIRRQVCSDGVGFEGSLGYHRLVTELFAYGAEVIGRNLGGGVSTAYEDRLRRMFRFIDTYLPPSGEAPMVGDADDGRLHAVSAAGTLAPRLHRLGLPARFQSENPPTSTAFAEGGFYVLRRGSHHAVIRCGPVGLRGAGPHDHNDQLALELVLDGIRVIADSGTYTYTRDLEARFAFRKAAAHSVVQLRGEEPNPIRSDRPWRVLADRTRSECTRWETDGTQDVFVGRHFGYAHHVSHAICYRRLVLSEMGCQLIDRVDGTGLQQFAWRLHFAPGRLHLIASDSGRTTIGYSELPALRIEIAFPDHLAFGIRSSPASDRYGQRHSRPCIELSGEARLPVTVHAEFRVGGR